MNIVEKTAYLKGLADGLGLDPASKEGKLWNALNDLLGDIAHELEDLRETDRGQAQAIDGVADELSYLEELCGGFDTEDDEDEGRAPYCGGCCQRGGEPSEEDDEDEELQYDGVIYDATCPVCGEEISFDEETLEKGSILCPKCGEKLEFELGEEEESTGKTGDKNEDLPF